MLKFFYYLKYNDHPARIRLKSKELVGFSCEQGFDFFKHEKFRKALDFKNQKQAEQDRLFNELIVTNIVMILILLDQKIAASDPDSRRDYLRALRSQVPSHYYGFLKKIGIPADFVETWRQLTDLRHDEYARDMLDWRQVLMKKDSKLGEDNTLAIFQALAFGLFRHLRRGQTEKDDPFYREIEEYLLPVFKKQEAMIG